MPQHENTRSDSSADRQTDGQLGMKRFKQFWFENQERMGFQNDSRRMAKGCQIDVKWMSKGCQKDIKRMSIGYQKDVKRMWIKGVKRMSKGCQKDVKRMSKGYQMDVNMIVEGQIDPAMLLSPPSVCHPFTICLLSFCDPILLLSVLGFDSTWMSGSHFREGASKKVLYFGSFISFYFSLYDT